MVAGWANGRGDGGRDGEGGEECGTRWVGKLQEWANLWGSGREARTGRAMGIGDERGQ